MKKLKNSPHRFRAHPLEFEGMVTSIFLIGSAGDMQKKWRSTSGVTAQVRSLSWSAGIERVLPAAERCVFCQGLVDS